MAAAPQTYYYAADYINRAQYGNPPPPLPLKGFENQYPGLVLRPSFDAINNPTELTVTINKIFYKLQKDGMITDIYGRKVSGTDIRLLLYPEYAEEYKTSMSRWRGGIRRNRRSTRNRKSNRARKSTQNRRSTRARKSTRR